MWWWMATTSSPCPRSALRVGVTSLSNIATSPATAASSSVPTNATQGLSPKKVIVKGCDFQPMLKEGRHNGIHFFLQEHEISHHYVIPTVTLRQSKPSTETERRRHRVVRNAHVQIVARYVDLEHVGLVV